MSHSTARIAGFTLLAAATCGLFAAAAPPDDAAAIERLRHENARLKRLADLASGDDFYLMLDPRKRVLQLMYEGVVLNEFPVLDLALGERRVLFVTSDLPEGWEDQIWDDGQLDPPRQVRRKEIIPPKDGEPADPVEEIPPTPEEAVPAPDRYWVRYADGRSLEIVGDLADEPSGGLLHRSSSAVRLRLSDLAAALLPSRADALRLRVTLRDDQARALYRALPEQSRFLLDLSSR